jgi:uncharacterized protein DUF3883
MASSLEPLRPTEKIRVYDAAREIGLDVRDWADFKGGAKRAAMNPKYCYEWALMQPGGPVLLNLWHSQLEIRDGRIIAELNLRRHGKAPRGRGAKEIRRQRALRMDECLRAAFGMRAPVRVLVLEGVQQTAESDQASMVKKRKLDPETWTVTSYDVTSGDTVVSRGVSFDKPVVRSKVLDRLRADVIALADEIISRIKSETRSSQIGFIPADRRRAFEDGTGGFAVRLGDIRGGIGLEIWLDHFSGWTTPRLWAGFAAGSLKLLKPLLDRPPLVGLKDRLLQRSSSDLATRPVSRFQTPLAADEFDVLVEEAYGSQNYLGLYQPYVWPFTDNDRGSVVRETAALFADVAAGLGHVVLPPSVSSVESSRWARPDPRSEKAAIHHVTRFLRKSGYSVRSRELDGCGYDLHASGDTNELHVEVKGCNGPLARFFISRREMATAKADGAWRLAVVTNASNKPTRPQLLTYAQMEESFDLEPIQWAGNARG